MTVQNQEPNQPNRVEFDEATAADRLQWLFTSAGSTLQGFAGGTTHAPVITKRVVEELQQIADTAGALADYYDDDDLPEDPAVTPFDQLPEDAQKALRENQDDEQRKLREAQGLDPDVPVSDPQPPESKEAKVTSPDTRASEGLTPAQARAQQKKAVKDEG